MSDAAYFTAMEEKIPTGKVRTRFAPSPTGYMHIGNLRTALYTWLIARHADGTFILRIEDTDQGRLVEGATDVIYRTMKECHLDHDEGPDVGGPTGPYIQSERRDLYLPYAQLLVEKGAAYYCFCEKAESEEDSGEFDRADDPCRNLSEEEVEAAAESDDRIGFERTHEFRARLCAGESGIGSDVEERFVNDAHLIEFVFDWFSVSVIVKERVRYDKRAFLAHYVLQFVESDG